jgi:hypothetical protein
MDREIATVVFLISGVALSALAIVAATWVAARGD